MNTKKRTQSGIARASTAEELAAIYAHGPGIIFCLAVESDENFRFVSANEALLTATGLTANQVVGKLVEEVIPAPSRAVAMAHYRKALRTKETVRWEEASDHPAGRKHGMASVSPMLDPSGTCTHLIGIVLDITESKQTKEALRASEERYRLVASASQTAFWDWDLKTNMVIYSRIWGNQLGYEDDELGDSFEEFRSRTHPEDLADLMAKVGASVANPALPLKAEFRLRHKDGSWRWIWCEGIVIRELDGQPARMIGTNTDITERKRSEEAIAVNEERYRLVADASQTGFWDWDLKTNHVHYSRIWKSLLGYAGKEIDDTIDEFRSRVHPDEIEGVLINARAAIADPGASFQVEYRMRHKDGSWRWIASRGIVLRDGTGTPFRMIGAHVDITGRKQIEESLRALNGSLEDRVAGRTAQLLSANKALRKEAAARKRLETEVLAISEREQRRIGQDLHDDLGQQLAALSMLAGVLETRLQRESSAHAAVASDMVAVLRKTIESTRTLAQGLYPVDLERGGLATALQELALRSEATSGVRVTMHNGRAPDVPLETAIHLYRIAQEAMSNAIKHAQARHILISWSAVRGRSALTITNDGLPFVPPKSSHRGIGLHLFRDRARLIGADFEIGAGPAGGCKVTCTLKPPRTAGEAPRR